MHVQELIHLKKFQLCHQQKGYFLLEKLKNKVSFKILEQNYYCYFVHQSVFSKQLIGNKMCNSTMIGARDPGKKLICRRLAGKRGGRHGIWMVGPGTDHLAPASNHVQKETSQPQQPRLINDYSLVRSASLFIRGWGRGRREWRDRKGIYPDLSITCPARTRLGHQKNEASFFGIKSNAIPVFSNLLGCSQNLNDTKLWATVRLWTKEGQSNSVHPTIEMVEKGRMWASS